MEAIFFYFFLILLEVMFTPFMRKHLKNKLCVIPVLIAAGTAAYQMYQSKQQRDLAKKMKPSNYVPPAVQEAEQNARVNANALSSGYTRSLDLLKRSTANTIHNAKRTGGSLSTIQQAVADSDAREKSLIRDLEVNEAANRSASRNQLNNILMQKGAFQKDSQDNYNAAVSALKASSQQNTFNAITGLSEGVVRSLPDKYFDRYRNPFLNPGQVQSGGQGNPYSF
jgi:hypothetical protein